MCDRAMPSPATEEGTGTLVDRLIALAGVQKVDHIAIVGCKALDVLLALCRRGFLRATCRASAGGPHMQEDAVASLWILDAENAADMRTKLAAGERDLRPDGTLIVNFDFLASLDKATRIKNLLMECGFVPVRKIHAYDRYFFICTRKEGLRQALAA